MTGKRGAASHNGTGFEDVPVGELVRGIADDASTLVRKELELAKQEVTDGVKGKAVGIGALVSAGVLAVLALAFLGSTIAAALDHVMAPWLSRLLVTLLYLGGAGGAVWFGMRAMKRGSLTAEVQQGHEEA